MMGLIITIHVIVCILLIALILIQRGRGGGLAESFSDVESMLGTKTNAFLTRTTTVLSVLFFITCLSLAVFSIKQSRSLLKDVKPQTAATEETEPVKPSEKPEPASQQAPATEGKAAATTPVQEAPKTE